MSFTYDQDDTRRLLIVTFKGALQASDACVLRNRYSSEGVFDYGVLCEFPHYDGASERSWSPVVNRTTVSVVSTWAGRGRR